MARTGKGYSTRRRRWDAAQEFERTWWEKNWMTIAKNETGSIEKYWNYHRAILDRHAEIRPGTAALEIGGGPTPLISYIGDCRKFALDPLIGYYSQHFQTGKGIQRVRGVGESLPFRDESIDIIILTNVIDHVMSPENFLCECQRVLAEGGIMYLTVNCHDSAGLLYMNAREKRGQGDIAHPFSFSDNEISGIIEKSSFRITFKKEGIGDIGDYVMKKIADSIHKDENSSHGSRAQKGDVMERIRRRYGRDGISGLADSAVLTILKPVTKKKLQEHRNIIIVASKNSSKSK